mmetsp:Transcript_3841/g.8319  ORF Transcript_3841/g.8319 Transcript_3841/m.8319 type:complete len:202 (-) Transcript_3841:635-1240(-)
MSAGMPTLRGPWRAGVAIFSFLVATLAACTVLLLLPPALPPSLNEGLIWRIAYLHIPKTGGTSVGNVLHRDGVAACKAVTSYIRLCHCRHDECVREVQPRWAVLEASYARSKAITDHLVPSPPAKWLWVATIRQPSSWFYSVHNATKSDKRMPATFASSCTWCSPAPVRPSVNGAASCRVLPKDCLPLCLRHAARTPRWTR